MEALANAAFPTLPRVSNKPSVSLFDLEESASTPIASALLYGSYPINEKRGKVRTGYMMLESSSIKIYKSQKDGRLGKPPVHSINLIDVFNICVVKEPLQIKDDCVSIMNATETFYIKPTNSKYITQDWFEYLLEKCRSLRCIKFGRPVFREEFFEGAWDVYFGPRPKFKCAYDTPKNVDLGAKHPEGRRRLCIQASNVKLFKLPVMPSPELETPFQREQYINLPMHVISSYGNQEHVFLICAGRLSEVGSSNFYLRCEGNASAKAIHDIILEIFTRESERRKAQDIMSEEASLTGTNSRMKKRRERGDGRGEAEIRARLDMTQAQVAPSSGTATKIAPSFARISGKSKKQQEIKVANSSKMSKTTMADCTGNNLRKKSSIAGLLPSFRLKLGSGSSTTRRDVSVSSNTDIHPPLSTVAPPSIVFNTQVCHGSSTSVDVVGNTFTMPSSSGISRLSSVTSTLRASGMPCLVCESSYNNADDYMPCDPHGKGGKHGLLNDSLRKGSTSFSGIFTHQSSYAKSLTITKRPTRSKPKRGNSTNHEDYLEMDENVYSSSDLHPILTEISAKILNVCDSPQSLDASNAPRAYSFGTKSRPAIGEKSDDNSQQEYRSSEEMQGRNCSVTRQNSSTGCTSPSSCRTTNTSTIIVAECNTPLTVREKSLNDGNENSTQEKSKSTVLVSDKEPSNQLLITSGATVADLVIKAGDNFSDLRKRAHSLGSKTWKKPSFLKIGKRAGGRFIATSTHATPNTTLVSALSTESRTRADSDSTSAGNNALSKMGRENSVRLNTPAMITSRSLQPDEDHVEFDFDSSCPSIESPINRSRNSSFGVQLPSTMRTALDLALSTNRSFAVGYRPSERYLESLYGNTQAKMAIQKAANRKPSVSNEVSPNNWLAQKDTVISSSAKRAADSSHGSIEEDKANEDDYVMMNPNATSSGVV